MPELPDLEIIREFLSPRLTSVNITSVEVRRPLVVRNLLGGELDGLLIGRHFVSVGRRGKFLLLELDGGKRLVINPMLAGRIRYGEKFPRPRMRDALVLGLADGRELRYHDAADMGKVYLACDLDQVPAFAGQGPEATDPALTLDIFRERLRPYRGEVKGVLTNQSFVAGIGNAYADEILWSAHIYPFRHRPDLDGEDITQLYVATRFVLSEAIVMLAPRWVYVPVQPISVFDVVSYLIAALRTPESAGQNIEIGGPEVLTYGDMVMAYVRMRRLRHVLLPLPVFGAQLSAYWVHWATPISANMAYSLIEGLRAPVVVHDDTARRLFPEIKPMDYTTVLKNSLARVDAGQVDTSWSDALATSQGDVAPVTFAWREGMFIERRQRITAAPPEQLYRVFTGLGGEHGWLEFEAQPQPDGTTRLLQTAFYVPRGFLGHVYWYSLVPFHAFIFSGLIDQIVRHAEANAGIMRERKLATA